MERRADPQVNHRNRDIDQTLTQYNFEVGPTAGMSYAEKCAHFDALLDRWGYEDGDICMQSLVVYPPDELVTDAAIKDGRLSDWFAATADTICDAFGVENVISMDVDVDEVHNYVSAIDGKEHAAKPHMHVRVVPVCDVKPQTRVPVYLTPDGKETTDETLAAQTYVSACGGETDNADEASLDDDGEPMMRPRRARTKTGKTKWKKTKAPADATPTRKLSGSDFYTRGRVKSLNDTIDRMTRERFAVKWNTHAPRDPERQGRPVEELKNESAELLDARLLDEAAAEIETNVEASQRLLADAAAAREDAVSKAEAEAEAKAARIVAKAKANAEAERTSWFTDANAFNAELDERESSLDEREDDIEAREDAVARIKADARAEADRIRTQGAREAHDVLAEALAIKANADPLERFSRWCRAFPDANFATRIRDLVARFRDEDGKTVSERERRTRVLSERIDEMRGRSSDGDSYRL